MLRDRACWAKLKRGTVSIRARSACVWSRANKLRRHCGSTERWCRITTTKNTHVNDGGKRESERKREGGEEKKEKKEKPNAWAKSQAKSQREMQRRHVMGMKGKCTLAQLWQQ
jgi:hypothetical protein